MTDFRMLAALALALSTVACATEAPPPPPPAGSEAAPRKDDPALTHSWNMGAGSSPVATGDLGSNPDTAAQALMDQGMPSIAHKIATSCKESGALKGTQSVALRFELRDDGKVGQVSGDPAGAAATCMAGALAKEAAALQRLPAGDALLRIKFHPAS